jgi:hypothetical protein
MSRYSKFSNRGTWSVRWGEPVPLATPVIET